MPEMKETLRARSQHALFPLKTPAKNQQNIARAQSEYTFAVELQCDAMRRQQQLLLTSSRTSNRSSASSTSRFAAGAAACALLFWCLCCLCCSQNHSNRNRSKRNRSQNEAKTRPKRGLKAYPPPTKALLHRKITRFD